MKIIQRYILSEFLKVLSMTLLSFAAVFFLVEFVEKVDDLIEHGVPFGKSALYFLYKLPYIFNLISPVAVLLAVLITLGIFTKHGEVTAIKAGGVSLLRAFSPLLLVGLVISAAVIFMNETITPFTDKQIKLIELQHLKRGKAGVFGKNGLWLKAPGGIYNIRRIDKNGKQLEGVTYYKVSKKFDLTSRITARKAEWRGSRWVAKEALISNFPASGHVEEVSAHNFVFPTLKGPEEFTNIATNYENLSFKDLKAYIRELEEQGYDTARYRVDLYAKLTFPLVNFIMVLLGIPFALKSVRHGGIADGIALSVMIGFSYWIVFALTRSLGHGGILPPIIAAASPDVLFLAVGVFLLSYVRQ